jgi:hypothetical protein
MDPTNERPEKESLRREDCLLPDGSLNSLGLLSGIVAFIQQAYPELALSPPVALRASTSYHVELEDISRTMGEMHQATNTEDATGVAKTIDTGEYSIIVVEAGIFEWIFDERQHLLIHTVHHELCHAHEQSIHRQRGIVMPETVNYFRRIAEAIWSEYQAERRSAGTHFGENQQASILIERLDKLRQQQAQLIGEFRADLNLGITGGKAFGLVWDILSMLRYTLGCMAGTSQTPEELYEGLGQALDRSPLKDLWKPLMGVLDHLYATLGNWESLDVFAPLENMIRPTFNAFGYDVRETADGGLQVRLL